MRKSLAETHPELAKEWHPTKNGSLTPNDVTAGYNKKVWWYLPYDDPITGKHFNFEWEARISSRVNGTSCPYLSNTNKTIWQGYNDLTTTHPELAKEWHPTKNSKLTPNDVSAGSQKKVWWHLPYDDPATGKHFDFEWQSSVLNRIKGNGCPYLSGHAVWKGFNDLATTHPDIAREWHPTKNGSLKPENVTAYSRKKVWWLLPYDDPNTGKHFDFEWQATIANRINGCDCPYLSGHAMWTGYNDLATTHPKLVKEWHPAKNGNLAPSNIIAGSRRKTWWICPLCGYEYKTSINIRKQGSGCPLCSSSQGEKEIYNLLKSYSINFIKEYSFPDCKCKSVLRFDFAIFDKNNNKLVFLIEYDGEQHSDEINLFNKHDSYELRQKRDNIKNQYCKDNNIPLLRISYEDADKVEEIIIAKLKEYNLL